MSGCPGCGFAHMILTAPLHPISAKVDRKRPSGWLGMCPNCQRAFTCTAAGVQPAQWQNAPNAQKREPRDRVNAGALDGMKIDAPR